MMRDDFSILVPTRRWLLTGIVVSTAAHVLVLGGYVLLGRKVQEVVHRITFQPPPPPSVFVKPPRLTTRVLEFRKRPIPRGLYLRQRGVTRAKVAQVQAMAAVRTDALLRSLDARRIAPPSLRPTSRLSVGGTYTSYSSPAGSFGFSLPPLSVAEVKGVREVRRQMDMKLEMLRIEDMDTGEYRAMVVQDPDDRRKIKGYIYLAQVYSRSRAARMETVYGTDIKQQVTIYRSMDYLIKALHRYTGIKAEYIGPVALDDPKLLTIPWIVLPDWIGEPHALTEKELENLGRYLAGGGFAVAKGGGSEVATVRVFKEALKTQGLLEGAHWRLMYLKPDHPIYHAFFDFDMSVRENMFYTGVGFRTGDRGIEIGERLAVFIPSSRNTLVTDTAVLGTETYEVVHDATRSLQFAVNTIVFALTQEGSITQQLMAGIRR